MSAFVSHPRPSRRRPAQPPTFIASPLNPHLHPAPPHLCPPCPSPPCAYRPLPPLMRAPPGMPSFGMPRPAKPGEVAALLETVSTGDSGARLRALLATRELHACDAAPVICKLLDLNEESTLTRGFACLFLAYKPNARSQSLLFDVVENEQETPEVVSNAVAALGYLRNPAAVPLCLRLLRDPRTHWSTRSAAAVSIGVIAEAVPDVRAIVFDDLVAAFEGAEGKDPVLLQAIVGTFGDVRDVRCVGKIGKYVAADDFVMAQSVCEALGKLACEDSLRLLEGVLQSGAHVNVHWAAEIALKAVREAMQ